MPCTTASPLTRSVGGCCCSLDLDGLHSLWLFAAWKKCLLFKLSCSTAVTKMSMSASAHSWEYGCRLCHAETPEDCTPLKARLLLMFNVTYIKALATRVLRESTHHAEVSVSVILFYYQIIIIDALKRKSFFNAAVDRGVGHFSHFICCWVFNLMLCM